MASWTRALKRVTKDIAQLQAAGFKVEREDGRTDKELDPREWISYVSGPAGTPYEGGVWRVRITITADFPFTSPSVGFVDQIYHPNIEYERGAVCLDTLNAEWSPATALLLVFETFLPALLSAPNPDDPFNARAAAELKSNPEGYAASVRARAARHAFSYTPPAPPGVSGVGAPAPGPAPAAAEASEGGGEGEGGAAAALFAEPETRSRVRRRRRAEAPAPASTAPTAAPPSVAHAEDAGDGGDTIMRDGERL